MPPLDFSARALTGSSDPGALDFSGQATHAPAGLPSLAPRQPRAPRPSRAAARFGFGGIDPDTDALVRTVIGEAAGEDANGRLAVANVILNRSTGSGMSVPDVVLAKGQFEPWGNLRTRQRLASLTPDAPEYQSVLRDIQPALAGKDVTGGATHFYSPSAQSALGRGAPEWDNGSGLDIGKHRFFNIGYDGGRTGRAPRLDFSGRATALGDTPDPGGSDPAASPESVQAMLRQGLPAALGMAPKPSAPAPAAHGSYVGPATMTLPQDLPSTDRGVRPLGWTGNGENPVSQAQAIALRKLQAASEIDISDRNNPKYRDRPIAFLPEGVPESAATPGTYYVTRAGEVKLARSERPRTLGERYTQNVKNNLLESPAGALSGVPGMVIDPGMAGLASAFTGLFGGDPESVPDPTEFARGVSAERKKENAQFQERSKGDPYYEAPGGKVGQFLAGGATVGGQITGGLVDPTNLIQPEAGPLRALAKPVIGDAAARITSRAVGNAGVAAGADAFTQGVDISTGVRDQYSPQQTAGAAAVGAVISGGLDVAGAGGRAVVDSVKDARARGRATPGQPAAAPVPGGLDFTERSAPANDVTADFSPATDRFGPLNPPGRASPPPATAPRPAGGVKMRDVGPAKVFTPQGEPIDVTYGIADLRDLTPSHTNDLVPNPSFPADLQPRDRSRAASDTQITSIMRDLKPEMLDRDAYADRGAPIVGPDGVVESGNGRAIALSRLYESGDPAARRYVDYLKSQGYPVDGIEQPVLVARRDSALNPSQRVAFAQAANERGTASMSASEQSKADAGKLSGDLLDNYTGGGLSTEANAAFSSQVLSRIASPAELNALTDGSGRLSAEGERRIRAALTNKAYGDTALVASLYDDARPELGGLGRAAQDAAPAWAGMRSDVEAGTIPKELDATAALTEALSLVRQAREGKIKNLADVVATRDAFADRDPRVGEFLRMFHTDDKLSRVRSPSAIARDLEAYAGGAREAKSGSLFGEDGPTLSTRLLDGIVRRARGDEAKGLGEAPAASGEALAAGPDFSQRAVAMAPDNSPLSGVEPGELWRASPDTLERMLSEATLSDREKLVRALGGEEPAKEFERLDRARNSTDPRRADAASAEFDAKYGRLTAEQERLIYGVGETEAQADAIKTVLDAHRDVSPDHAGDPDEWVSYMGAVGARGLRAEDLAAVREGRGTPAAQAAFVRMQNAYQTLSQRGVRADEIPGRLVDALVQRAGWRPEQAAEIIGGFVDDLRAAAGPRSRKLPGPAGAGGVAALPRLDHGELNTPLAKRYGKGGIDAQIDRWKADQARENAGARRSAAEQKRIDKATAKELYETAGKAMVAEYGPRMGGEAAVKKHLLEQVTWEPRKFIALAERYAKEQDGGRAAGTVLGARTSKPKGGDIRAVSAELKRQGVNVTVEGQGPSGPILRGLEGNWGAAVKVLRALEDGDARGVLSHKDVGDIDVIWGNEAGGLAHILKDHPEVVADLPARLERMSAKSESTNRVILESGDGRAVVRLAYDDKAKTWLLTAYDTEGRQGGGRRTDRASPDGRADSPNRLAEENIAPGKPGSKSGPQGAIDLSAYGDMIEAASGNTKTGLRQAPQAGDVPTPAGKDVGVKSFEAETVSALAAKLKASLGLTARQGRMTLRGRAVGEFHPDTGVIRTKAVHEVDVLSHEGGHALEAKQLPALQSALKTHAKEVAPLHYPGTPKGQERSEGFAEFFRWYVTNPAYAKKVAPNFYGAFEGALAKDAPALLKDLQAIQSAYQGFLASPSASAIAASMVVDQPKAPVRDFMRSMKEDVGGTVGDLANDAYTSFVDDLHPIARAVAALQKVYAANKGAPLELRVHQNPYALARLSRDAYGAGHMDLMEGVAPYHSVDADSVSLADALSTALGDKWGKWDKDQLRNFNGYLASRRLVGEWKRYAAGELDNPPDKLSAAAHERAVKDFEGANPTWRDAAAKVYEWNNALWKKERDAGLISEKQYQEGLSQHADYVPLMRDMSDRDKVGGVPVKGNAKLAGGVKKFRGSTRDIIAPIQSMMRRAYELNALIARNDVFKALDDLGQLAGKDAGAIVERLPRTQIEAVTVDALEALENAAKAAGVSPRDISTMVEAADTMMGGSGEAKATVFRPGEINEKGEPIIYVWREGKKTPLRLPDGKFGVDMFRSLTGMNDHMKSVLVDIVAAPTQALRYGITTHPAFFLSNYIRDQVATWINTDVGFKPGWSGARGIASEVTQDRFSKLYNRSGGIVGGANVAALDKGRINADMQALRKKGYAVRRFASWHGFAQLTEVSETGTRLGVFKLAFKQAKREGLDDFQAAREAAFTARDLLDFGRQGSKMLLARRVVTFLNASLQGLDKAGRVLSANGNASGSIKKMMAGQALTKTERGALVHSAKAWAKVSALGVFGLALRALYADDPEYEEISDYLRDTHWMVKAGNEWVAIPKPFELAALSNIFERGYEGVAKDDPSAWGRLVKGLGNILVPPHEIPALAVPYDIARNRTNSGQPIIPDHLRYGVDPDMQFNSYTSDLGKWLGKVLHVSPAVIDYSITGATGSWGRDLLGVSTDAGKASRGATADKALTDIPVANRFVRDVTRSSTSSKQFWDLLSTSGGKLTEAEGTFRALMRDGRNKEAKAYLAKQDAPTRAYVFAEVFAQGPQKQINPLVRAREAASVISDVRRDAASGDLIGPRGEPIALTPSQRAEVDDALANLAMVEMRNALISAGVKGWEQKEPLPLSEAKARVYEADRSVGALLAYREATGKVADPVLAGSAWQRMRPAFEGTDTRLMDRLPALLQSKQMGQAKRDKDLAPLVRARRDAAGQ